MICLVKKFFLNILPSMVHSIIFSLYVNDKGSTEKQSGKFGSGRSGFWYGLMSELVKSDLGQNAYILSLRVLIYKNRIKNNSHV